MIRFQLFIYDIALHLLLLLWLLPKALFEALFKGKYRSSYKARLGIRFPHIERGDRPLIWLHAVSMGEMRAAAKLAKRVKESGNNPYLLVTTQTETGYEEAKRSLPWADCHHYLPLDLSYIIRPIVKRIRPDLVIVVESDFWPQFLHVAKSLGARIAVVNGKLSEKSAKRLSHFSWVSHLWFDPIDLFCLQVTLYEKRFLQLGVAKDKLVVTGNLKWEATVPVYSKEALRAQLGLGKDDLVLTLGSTHEPEEKIWLSVLFELWQSFDQLKVVLVPRHPERIARVVELLTAAKLRWGRHSEGADFKDREVVLVDVMGQLMSYYALSDVAFVGGSFAPTVGGHNIIEPLFYGVGVLFGPHMYSQPGMAEFVLEAGAGIQVSEQNVAEVVSHLLTNRERRLQLGRQGLGLVERTKGSLEQTVKSLLNLLEKE